MEGGDRDPMENWDGFPFFVLLGTSWRSME